MSSGLGHLKVRGFGAAFARRSTPGALSVSVHVTRWQLHSDPRSRGELVHKDISSWELLLRTDLAGSTYQVHDND